MIETGFHHFWELEAWKEARSFKLFIRDIARGLPAEEKFRLTDQLLRSSRSIGTQIAEGHGRFTWKDQINFCIVARGSLNETLNHLYDALDEKYITPVMVEEGFQKFKRVEVLLNGYIKYLRSRLNSTEK